MGSNPAALDRIWMLGDVHGEFRYLHRALQKARHHINWRQICRTNVPLEFHEHVEHVEFCDSSDRFRGDTGQVWHDRGNVEIEDLRFKRTEAERP